MLAHELLHLALRTHDRAKGSGRLEFNYAHDYIINDILRVELGFASIPAGGLDMPGAREKSAEEIVLGVPQGRSQMRSQTRVWEGQAVAADRMFGGNGSGQAQPRDAKRRRRLAGDVLGDKLEREWFPADAQDQAEREAGGSRSWPRKGLALAKALARMKGRGTDAGASTAAHVALRGHIPHAWQMALQKWLESVAPGERTFLRPSRRGSDRADVVLPGRKRESWMLNVVLDTSGSMTDEIPRALGAIAEFCDALAVDQIRLVQCDTAITSDAILSPDELAAYKVSGFGGSDLSPAMLALADDPHVTAAVIVTDGDIAYPAEEMPYGVLWVLPHARQRFNPRYGRRDHDGWEPQ